MKKATFIIMVMVLAIFFIIILVKSNVTENPYQKIEGTITEINEAGVKDATFKLAGNNTIFYINRGLENQFTLNQLRHNLINKNVTIFFIPHSSILSSTISSQQIRKLDLDEKTIYTEI